MTTLVQILYAVSIINALVVAAHGFWLDAIRDEYLRKDRTLFNIVDCSIYVLVFTWVFELIPVIADCNSVFPYLVFNIIFGTIHYTLIIKSYIYIKHHKD